MQRLTKLSDFIRESGELLSLLPSLLSTVVDLAVDVSVQVYSSSAKQPQNPKVTLE